MGQTSSSNQTVHYFSEKNPNSTNTSGSSHRDLVYSSARFSEMPIYNFATKETKLPSKIDLRVTACFPYLPPKDQGSEGACVTYAIGSAIECAQRRKRIPITDAWDPDIDGHFREAFTVAVASDASVSNTSVSNKSTSSKDSSDYGQSTNSNATSRKQEDGITFAEAAEEFVKQSNGVVKFYRLDTGLLNFKKCLHSGYPFVFGFTVTKRMRQWQNSESQQKQSDYVLPDFSEDDAVDGYHSVTAFGYDDSRSGGVFIVRNSWGRGWGDRGHFYMTYQTVCNHTAVQDAMIVDLNQ